MTALLAVEFEPGAEPHFAVNALRQSALRIQAIDARGARVHLLSGDHPDAVARVAARHRPRRGGVTP